MAATAATGPAGAAAADLGALHRPRLLVRAARFALDDYRRDRDLARLLPAAGLPSPARAVALLLDAEAACEAARSAASATYSAARHVDLLAALMAEARLAAAPAAAASPPASAQAKASGIAALRRAT
ncbi:MAG: hypothetical protein IT545_11685 [Rhodobacteraceae bacterium]|nr:hypothetical protein [Paracoccaceae bacterium]